MNMLRPKNRFTRRRLLSEQLETRHLLAGPYAPAAGQIGSQAIASDSPQIVAWATEVANYSLGTNVDAGFRTPDNSLGPSDPLGGEANAIPDTVSLGRGGQITLTFDHPIRDGVGDDFAVFENSFSDSFLELAFVEVSDDGTNFTRFANDSLTTNAVEAFGSLDPTDIDGLAGKVRGGFGVGFDLADVGVDQATHVRLTDIIGDGSVTDSSGDPIYDPFATTGSAGFDLDAVGVIHHAELIRDVVDFEDLGQGLSTNDFFNGPVAGGATTTGPFSDTVVLGTFQSETLTLNNNHSQDFGSWNGFAYSNVVDTTTAGFGNQHAAFAGSGAGGSQTYGVGFNTSGSFYDAPTIERTSDDDRQFESVAITNTTYAALSMANGDMFAKKFGGVSGGDPDFLSLTITGLDASDSSIGTVEFFLADFRFADNSLDYIVDEWTTIDLSSLAQARSLQFSIDSSDVGSFGINTPTYFAIDDITLIESVLPMGLADGQVDEDAGSAATTLRISRANSDTSQTVVIDLASSAPTHVSVPATATIPIGRSFVDVPVSVVDNDMVNDDRSVVISGMATGFLDSSVTLSVVNDDLTLAISSSVSSVSESDAPPTATAEDLGRGLVPESFANRAPDAEGFQSGSLQFSNAFNSTFSSWSGWSVSNITDNTTSGFGNQYAAISGVGSADSKTYLVGNAFPGGFVPTVRRDAASTTGFSSIDITNTAYAALSMRDGDSFAKQFGGQDGTDPDFFSLTIEGVDAADQSVGTIDVSLADFQFADDSNDFILDTWQPVDLTSISAAIELRFSLASSDVGEFGMNTPAYFAADNVRTSTATSLPTVTVTRQTTQLAAPLAVTLSSSDASELTAPVTVVIPAGQSSVTVPVSVIPDFEIDGDQTVTVSASAGGFAGASTDMVITDADTSELTLTVSLTDVLENEGTVSAFLHRSADDVSAPLDVMLMSSIPGELAVPETVTIPVGQRTVMFDLTVADNEAIDPARTVTITATADAGLSDTSMVLIGDEDGSKPMLTLTIDPASISESDAPLMVGFEDIGAAIAADSFNNGSDLAGGFQSGPVSLDNAFNANFGSWSGWAISKTTDTETAGFTNQYSVITGGGGLSSDTYAVANTFGQQPPLITLDDTAASFDSIEVNNTTYAALSLREGDDFAKQFGGESGDDPDFFMLTIQGIGGDGESVGMIDFYLADFRFADNSFDYIVDAWTTVDVSSLSGAVELQFSLSSSDVGNFGMNTPAYFAVDNIVLVSDSPPTAVTATVTRENQDTSEPLSVSVVSDDLTEVSVPTTVVILAGETDATFAIQSVNDRLVDGTKTVDIQVSADGLRSATGQVMVADDDVPVLTVTPATPNITESDDATVSVLVHHNYESLSAPLVLSASSSGSELILPESIAIPVGQSSVSFDVSVVNDGIAQGSRDEVVTLAMGDSLANSATLTIDDDEVAGITALATGEEPFAVKELIGAGSFNITLSAQPLGNVTVVVAASNDQVTLDSESFLFTPDNWDQAQAAMVTSPPDLVAEDDQIITITMTASDSNDALLFEGAETTIDVIIRDYQPLQLSLGEVDGQLDLRDTDVDQSVLQATYQAGINLIASDMSQTLTVESLSRTRGPVMIDVGGGDDQVTLRSSRFTVIDGGDGTDTLTLQLAGNHDLASFIDQRVFGFEQIIVSSVAGVSSQITLDTASLERLVDDNGNLQLQVKAGSGFKIDGDFISELLLSPASEFFTRFTSGEFKVDVYSEASWQNVADRFDIDRTGDVTALDALRVINRIARGSSPELAPITSLDQFDGQFYDVNGDNQVTALDALQVVNQLERQANAAEGERVGQLADNAIDQLYPSSAFEADDEETDGLPWWNEASDSVF